MWNVEDEERVLSSDRTWFVVGQANIWYRKLGEGTGGPEVETDRSMLRAELLWSPEKERESGIVRNPLRFQQVNQLRT